MAYPKKVFKAYDIRGLLEEVTEELAEDVGSALAHMTGSKTIVVGRDMRSTSPALAEAAIRGITARGVNVIDIGLCSTPIFYYAVTFLEGVQGGLMVTASHNPAEYNGIKLMDAEGMPMSGDDIYAAIQSMPEAGEGELGTVEKRDVLDAYLDRVIELADLPDVSRFSLAVDYGNGMGALAMQPLLKRLGITATELYAEPDATFPNHQADPVQEKNLVDVKKLINEVKPDFGVAIDGDADRIGFLDEFAETIRGDLMLALFTEDLLKEKSGAGIAVAPNQTWAIFDAVEKYGGTLVETKIGHTNVSLGMKAVEAEIGGEISSHFFFKDFGYLESPEFALCLTLKKLVNAGEALSEIVAPLRKYSNSGEVNLEIDDKAGALEALKEKYTEQASKVNLLDGVRCDFGRDWWFIVRPSNTEPLLRVTVEAKNQELMQEKVEELVSFIESL